MSEKLVIWCIKKIEQIEGRKPKQINLLPWVYVDLINELNDVRRFVANCEFDESSALMFLGVKILMIPEDLA